MLSHWIADLLCQAAALSSHHKCHAWGTQYDLQKYMQQCILERWASQGHLREGTGIPGRVPHSQSVGYSSLWNKTLAETLSWRCQEQYWAVLSVSWNSPNADQAYKGDKPTSGHTRVATAVVTGALTWWDNFNWYILLVPEPLSLEWSADLALKTGVPCSTSQILAPFSLLLLEMLVLQSTYTH